MTAQGGDTVSEPAWTPWAGLPSLSCPRPGWVKMLLPNPHAATDAPHPHASTSRPHSPAPHPPSPASPTAAPTGSDQGSHTSAAAPPAAHDPPPSVPSPAAAFAPPSAGNPGNPRGAAPDAVPGGHHARVILARPQPRRCPPHGSAPAQESTSTLEEHWELTGGDPSFLPSPSNLPSSEADTLYVPRKDIWTLTDQPGIDMFTSGPAAWGRLPQVYVILFGVGERDTEGIYSLRAIGDDGLPTETIISFENEEDAQQYSGLLEATMEHTPAVCSISPRELMDFCAEQGYSCRLEPRGSLLIPPDYNVGVTDWERSLRLREGRWMVLEEEPERSSSSNSLGSKSGQSNLSSSPSAGGGAAGGGGGGGAVQTKPNPSLNLTSVPGVNFSTLARYSGLSSTEQLDTIRARLEKLLP
ncbi:MAG: hypothetical protein WDW36_004321 [Sanguina aurantia]